jgi:hypothetical protein
MPHSTVQSVIFPKSVFTQKKAVGWLRKHNYDHDKVDATDNYYRFRQSDPTPGSGFYTVRLHNGVELICEKEAHESSSESESDSEQSNKPKLIAEHKNLVKVLKEDKPKEIKAELAKQSEELKSMTPKKSSPAQIAHRKRFGEWIRAKSGKSFAEWLKSNA